jgi:hypothetical protein
MKTTTLIRSFLALSPMLAAFGCAVAIDETGEDLSVTEDGLRPPQICPAIAILCIEGYKPKQLPNCNQICVPDQGFECTVNEDCGVVKQ